MQPFGGAALVAQHATAGAVGAPARGTCSSPATNHRPAAAQTTAMASANGAPGGCRTTAASARAALAPWPAFRPLTHSTARRTTMLQAMACAQALPAAPCSGRRQVAAAAAAAAAACCPAQPRLWRAPARRPGSSSSGGGASGRQQRIALAAAAVPAEAAELEAEGQQQWAAAAALLQERCGLEPEAADAALLKAFGWKGQAFWRQVRGWRGTAGSPHMPAAPRPCSLAPPRPLLCQPAAAEAAGFRVNTACVSTLCCRAQERVRQAPCPAQVASSLDYLEGLGVGGEALGPLVAAFPEVLGLRLEVMQGNVQARGGDAGRNGWCRCRGTAGLRRGAPLASAACVPAAAGAPVACMDPDCPAHAAAPLPCRRCCGTSGTSREPR